jgi:hypothetical protein
MTVPATPERAKHHRFPAEIMSHGVWRYDRFCLSYRDVEERLFARGVIVTDAAIRQWCRTCGQAYAKPRRRPRPGDKWPVDEGGLTSHGARHALGRAVDQDGHVRDMLVHSRRHTKAAQKCFRTWLNGLTWGGTSPAPRSEPPRGTFPPTDAPTGATQAAGEGPRARPPVSRRVWAERPPLPTATPSAFRP